MIIINSVDLLYFKNILSVGCKYRSRIIILILKKNSVIDDVVF